MKTTQNIILRYAVLALILAYPAAVHGQVGGNWNEIKGTHFVIYNQGSAAGYSLKVMKKAEQFYNQIAGDLGYSRRSQFWLWENRCKIYLYPDRESFLSSAGQATAWSNGYTIPEQRTIVSYEGSDVFLASILPHELAHLVFRDFVGLENGTIPLWLDEGVAMSQERDKRGHFDRLVKQMIVEGKWVPIAQLNKIGSLQGFEPYQASVFYAQAQSMVRFMLKNGGPSDRFIQFCRNLRDGKTLDEAFSGNYQRKFPSLQKFEEAWVQANG